MLLSFKKEEFKIPMIKEKLLVLLYELTEKYLYHHSLKGTTEDTITIPEEKIREISEKYNLSEEISDYEFKVLEDKIDKLRDFVRAQDDDFDFYSTSHGLFMFNKEAVQATDKLMCFVCRGYTKNYDMLYPCIGSRIAVALKDEFVLRMKNLSDSLYPGEFLNFLEEMEEWNYTQEEYIRYFNNAAINYLVSGEEFNFAKDVYEGEIDWDFFNDYIDKNSRNLTKENIKYKSYMIFDLYDYLSKKYSSQEQADPTDEE